MVLFVVLTQNSLPDQELIRPDPAADVNSKLVVMSGAAFNAQVVMQMAGFMVEFGPK